MKNKIYIDNIAISNPDKILFPKDNITKLDVINYYLNISNLMLPLIDKRLVSVIRCHENINKEKFFKKHPTTEGENVSRFLLNDEYYFYLKNQKELIYQVQMGSIEFHTWGSKVSNIERPNLMVFDLDPDEKMSVNKLREGVSDLKYVLDSLNLKSYLKTSGGKGYHIIVPFSKKMDWEEFGDFSKNIALLLETKWSNLFTTNIRKDERKGKIFVDYLRNKKGATCVAPYSLRARDFAPISFPISWKDLEKVTPNEINISNYENYIKEVSPWNDLLPQKNK